MVGETQSLCNYARILMKKGMLEESLQQFAEAFRLEPGNVDACAGRGDVLHVMGRREEAVEWYQLALSLDPGHTPSLNSLGIACTDLGRLEEAVVVLRKAAAVDPGNGEVHNNLGISLKELGRLEEAEESCRRALAINPDNSGAWSNLGLIMKAAGRLNEAIDCQNKSLAVNPGNPDTFCNLGNVLKELGLVAEAAACYRKALDLRPDFPEAHSNLLFCLHNHPEVSAGELCREAIAWEKAHCAGLTSLKSHGNSTEADRPLRIGYVSPDFKTHSVANFIEPVLASHNHEQYAIYCYSDASPADEVTDRLRGHADHWRDIAGIPDQQVMQLILDDGIDILVDLAGHTSGNRLLLFARKPAPLQVSWLGYPGTTGVSAIDYRLTDGKADPPGTTAEATTEALLRLPDTFLCFLPNSAAPPVGPLPAQAKGSITFGSFNNFGKVTEEVVALWSDILLAVPDSSLLLKFRGLGEEKMQTKVRHLFNSHGISPDRLLLLAADKAAVDHLDTYNRVDIALDTFPYNGTTTTCEALWMGVPVVTLAGGSHVSRVGVSLLESMGHPELVARSAEHYRSIAAELAGDRERLAALRGGLRREMAASSLTAATRFTENLENCFRHIWQEHCLSGRDLLAGAGCSRRLHLGGWQKHPDWEIFDALLTENVDHLGDARDLSRFADGTFTEMYASHILEHFPYGEELLAVLREWRRVLRPGGKLSVSVPDLDKLCNMFLQKEQLSLEERFHVMRMMFGGHVDSYDYHYAGLNGEFLEMYLRTAGFVQIRQCAEFGLFDDASTLHYLGLPVSVNLMAENPSAGS